MRSEIPMMTLKNPNAFEKTLIDAFGQPLSRQLLTQPLRLTLPCLVYITGESGSGKTFLLQSLTESLTERARVAGLPSLPAKTPLIRCHKDEPRWLAVLCQCGLADARMWLTPCGLLSEGQKTRARIAMALMNAADWDVLIVDDFLNALDRQCARNIAHLFGRQLRRIGKSGIVATSINDLLSALKPDWHIHVPLWGDGIQTTRLHWNDMRLPELSDVWVIKGSYAEAKGFLPLHYRCTKGLQHKEVFIAFYRLDQPIACCIVNAPIPNTHHHRLPRERDIRRVYDWHQIGVIARVIVHPHWRGLGIGKLLVRTVIEQSEHPFLLIGAAMLKFHNFLKGLPFVYWTETRNGTVEWWAYEREPRKVLPNIN